MNAGRVEENNLRVVLRQNALNATARGLRLIGRDCDFLPDDFIDKGRLADVRTPDYGDESRFIHFNSSKTLVPSSQFLVPSKEKEPRLRLPIVQSKKSLSFFERAG